MSNQRFLHVFLSGRETGVGASRKNAISRRRFLHGKARRRRELSPRYRLPRQGDRWSRTPSFGRHRYHSRRRWVSSYLFLSHCYLPRYALIARSIAVLQYSRGTTDQHVSAITDSHGLYYFFLFMICYITLLVNCEHSLIIKQSVILLGAGQDVFFLLKEYLIVQNVVLLRSLDSDYNIRCSSKKKSIIFA